MIRQATQQDIGRVKEIADALTVSREQENWRDHTSGFFELTIPEEDFLEAINPYFLVAETSQGIRGFILGFDHEFFRKTFPLGPDLSEYKQILHEENENYLYINLLGVSNPGTLGASRIANSLLDTSIEIAKSANLEKLLAFVSHSPFYNQRSSTYLRKKGFRQGKEITVHEDIKLGFYHFKFN